MEAAASSRMQADLRAGSGRWERAYQVSAPPPQGRNWPPVPARRTGDGRGAGKRIRVPAGAWQLAARPRLRVGAIGMDSSPGADWSGPAGAGSQAPDSRGPPAPAAALPSAPGGRPRPTRHPARNACRSPRPPILPHGLQQPLGSRLGGCQADDQVHQFRLAAAARLLALGCVREAATVQMPGKPKRAKAASPTGAT